MFKDVGIESRESSSSVKVEISCIHNKTLKVPGIGPIYSTDLYERGVKRILESSLGKKESRFNITRYILNRIP